MTQSTRCIEIRVGLHLQDPLIKGLDITRWCRSKALMGWVLKHIHPFMCLIFTLLFSFLP